MARKDQKTEIQHYVPKLLLRNHRSNPDGKIGSEQIWVYDKQTDKIFRPNIKNIASESGFYDFQRGEKTLSIEPHLSELESKAAIPISKIIDNEALSTMSDDERQWLAAFAAVQFVRVETIRDGMRKAHEFMKQKILEMGGDPYNVVGFSPIGENEVKELSAFHIVDAIKHYVPHFLSKTWCLLQARENDPFYIGDTPVALFNEKTFGPYGNIGLALRGIEIYFPISSKLCLWITDPGNLQPIFESVAGISTDKSEIEKLRASAALTRDKELKAKLEAYDAAELRLTTMTKSITQGSMLSYDPQVVMRANSIQIRWAGRFVMCAKRHFDLVERMIKDYPETRSASVFKIS